MVRVPRAKGMGRWTRLFVMPISMSGRGTIWAFPVFCQGNSSTDKEQNHHSCCYFQELSSHVVLPVVSEFDRLDEGAWRRVYIAQQMGGVPCIPLCHQHPARFHSSGVFLYGKSTMAVSPKPRSAAETSLLASEAAGSPVSGS